MPNQSIHDPERVSELAYEEAKSLLADQHATLVSIRERASAAMGLAGLVATFLGGAATSETDTSTGSMFGSFSIEEWAAIIVLVSTLGLTIWILWPRKWVFNMQPTLILRQFSLDNQVPMSETYIALCAFSEDNYNKNEPKLNRMFVGLNAIFILVGIQIVFWLISLGG